MSISEPPAGETGQHGIAWRRVHDRYRIVRELGSGAFGTVFLAEDEQTAQRVAIRVLPRAASAVPNIARIIQSTSRSIMAAPTSHPALVGVLEVGEVEPGRLSVVTEFVEGRRLSEILAAGQPLDLSTARRWVLDLGGAIEVLHNLGYVHGAIRPRNVMVLADGRLKLMDIELAGLRDTPTLRDANLPAEYLAPEQISNTPWTEKTDSYAFGLLVYDVFCGGPPFQGSSREAILAKQLTEPPTPMSRRRAVPAAVETIVAQALEKDQKLRPWMHEMLNGLWGETTVPATNGASGQPPGWKRLATFVGSAVAAAAAIVLAIWGLVGLRSSPDRSVVSAPSAVVERAPVGPRGPSPSAVSRSPARSPAPAVAPPRAAVPERAVVPPPAVTPPSPAKPAPPASAASPPAAPLGAVATAPPPAKAATPETRAAETRANSPQLAPAPVPIATAPDARPSAGPRVTPGVRASGPTAVAEPQLEQRTYRVGWLDPGRVSPSYQEIVRQSLVGYPRDIAFEYRYAGGRVDRLPELAAELVQLKVAILFAVGNQASQAAKQATSTIPIVIVGSDAGGSSANVTGVTYASSDLARGWLRLLKEIRPGLSRVAVLYAADASSKGELASVQSAAANAGVAIQAYPLHEGDALGSLLARPASERAEGIIVPGGPAALIYLSQLIGLANRARIPTVYGSAEFAEAGGLVAYGPSTPAIYRRAGAYIGKILGPTSPRDLPIEGPSRSELVVNLKAARALGLALPESVVRRADRVLR